MDGFNSVRDAETQSVDIFSTILPKDLIELIGRTEIPSEVIDKVVLNYNTSGLEVVDDYLLYEEKITQDEREIIVEALFEFSKLCAVNFRTMNKTEFKNKVETLVFDIEDIINEMPYKGDSETESQKIYLINQLNQFSYAVNGVEDEDFELDDET